MLVGKAMKFGAIAQGTVFSLKQANDGREYMNIKVPFSMVAGGHAETGAPFNAIALRDGRPRTFDESEIVYCINKEDFYG